MELLTISAAERREWADFIKKSPFAPFQQTYAWGDFQKSLGRDVFNLAFKESGRYLLAALAVKHPLPFGKAYFYIPRGPVLEPSTTAEEQAEILGPFFEQLGAIARREKVIFARFDPAINKDGPVGLYLNRKYRDATGSIRQPENTLILDLAREEEEILGEMKSKTRYNIRLATKKGVVVDAADEPTAFLKLNRETAERDRFQSHEDAYYKNLLKFFADDEEIQLKLLVANYERRAVAAIILAFYNDTALYLHGASAYEYRNVMAPHLLQWAGIKMAKERGLRYYDFWGIAPKDEPNHPWAGITRFKLGFGGDEVNYVRAREAAFAKGWYTLARVAKKIF